MSAVAAQAGVAKGTFYVYFPDREGFVDALHQRFYEQTAAAVADAVTGLEPGRDLLVAGVEAYLDACLANRAVKALALESRAQGSTTETMAGRVAELLKLAEPSVRALGLTPARISTRLIMALTTEAAFIELEAGRKVPSVRGTIRTLLTVEP